MGGERCKSLSFKESISINSPYEPNTRFATSINFDGSVAAVESRGKRPLSQALSGFRSLYVLRPPAPEEWFLVRKHHGIDDVDDPVVCNDVDGGDIGIVDFDAAHRAHSQ